MKKLPILFCLLSFLPLTAQWDSLQLLPLDSVFTLLEGEVADVNQTHAYDKAYQKAYYVLGRAQQEGDPEKIAKAHKIIADWHYYSVTSNNPDSFYYHDLQTLIYLKQTNQPEKIAKAYDRVGKDLIDLGRFLESEEYLFEVVRIYESLELPKALGGAYSSLNALYRESKDYEQALLYGERSLALIEANKAEDQDLIQPLLGLIHTYPHTGQPELALEKAQQVVDIIKEKYGPEDNIHLANVRSWRGKVYVALEDYDQALEDFRYSWNFLKTFVEHEEEADGWKGDIGNVLRLQGKYSEAIPYIRDYLLHLQERNLQFREDVEDSQFWLADCYEHLNQPDSARLYLNQAQALQNERLTEELAAVRSELRIKYDSDQKEATISSQQATIDQQAKIQYLSFGVGGLLIALLGGGFFNYRTNQRKNRQLQILNNDLATSNQQLDQRNAQNELLLKEIHHRVKNNLEVVSSLLELQSAQIQDQHVKAAILEGQSRVHSIGIVHQKLYQGANLGAIEMKEYFLNLSESILDTFGAEDRVTIECAMDQLEVDIDTAVPLGLIVNELLTNTLKYAFPNGQKGRVHIQLEQEKEDLLRLKVADNGVGKSGVSEGTGFGGQLIALLTRQLSGRMREEIRNGTSFVFEFNLKNQFA